MAAVLTLPVAGHSQTRKEIYELQERCGKSATALFDRDFPKEDRKGLETFENHYNVRLNKCFIIEENTTFVRDQGKVTDKIKPISLVDVQDNKSYGEFSSLGCNVQEQQCHSEQEFRALARRFMEN